MQKVLNIQPVYRGLLFILACCLYSFAGKSQCYKLCLEERNYPKGPIKEFTEECRFYGEVYGGKTTIKFNRDKNVSEIIYYSNDDVKIFDKHQFFYNNLSISKEISNTDTLYYVWDQSGNLIEKNGIRDLFKYSYEVDGNGELTITTIKNFAKLSVEKFDTKLNPVYIATYNDGKIYTSHSSKKYNSRDQIIEEIIVIGGSERIEERTMVKYAYDNNGNISEVFNYEDQYHSSLGLPPSWKLTSRFTYQYDYRNNLTEETCFAPHQLWQKVYKYKYDDYVGNWVERADISDGKINNIIVRSITYW